VLAVAAAIGYYVYYQGSSSLNANRTSNFNYNRSTNTNSNANSTNSNSNSNSGANSNSEAGTDSSSMSDDDKHKLFQAAGATHDTELITRALKKMGFINASGVPTDDYAEFVKEHFAWALKNTEFIRSVSTPEKARAYAEAHL